MNQIKERGGKKGVGELDVMYGECEEEADIFFFKQKTAYEIKECDWSSDVCSSDLCCSRLADNPSDTKGQ